MIMSACQPLGQVQSGSLSEPVSESTAEIAVPADILSAIAAARIVYLGETHTSAADHAAQLEIIQALHQRNPNLAIGLEMFQRPFQPVLDRYAAGDISEAELLAQTEYETRWGYPWELYAPIVRYAKTHEIPLIALNAPAEITSQVAREGLSSLTDSDLRYIPPLAEIDTTDAAYRAFLSDILTVHSGPHGGFDLDNFFAAQVVWDETMAESLAEFAQANPETQVIALVGEGHIVYDFGIPNRVQRRLGDDLTHYSVILNPSEEAIAAGAGSIADFFWVSDPVE
ncbi:MAG: ChaN family lipoprotein [Leptolyngbya sp. SIO4C1]|nr:ChaN family lipoprotein [Leptolyngbya sp. SIO4C1]